MSSLVGKSLQTGKYLLYEERRESLQTISYQATDRRWDSEVIITTVNLKLQNNIYLNDLRKKFLNRARKLITHGSLIFSGGAKNCLQPSA
ncbi:MAG: hypothetical protein QNJ54_32695 [Prochloraceae cyanobacterium]|nr:hypothetical protein [Prochloraceae cyanobacterium]